MARDHVLASWVFPSRLGMEHFKGGEHENATSRPRLRVFGSAPSQSVPAPRVNSRHAVGQGPRATSRGSFVSASVEMLITRSLSLSSPMRAGRRELRCYRRRSQGVAVLGCRRRYGNVKQRPPRRIEMNLEHLGMPISHLHSVAASADAEALQLQLHSHRI